MKKNFLLQAFLNTTIYLLDKLKAYNQEKEDKLIFLKAKERFFQIYPNGTKLEEAKYLIRESYRCLRFLSPEMKENKDLMLYAVDIRPLNIKYMLDVWKDDEQVALRAVLKDPHVIEYVSDRLKDNEDFVLDARDRNPMALCYISDRLKDKDEIMGQFLYNGSILRNAGPSIKKNLEKMRELAKNGQLEDFRIGDSLIDDKQLLLNAIRGDSVDIKDINPNLLNDNDICLKFLQSNSMINYSKNFGKDVLRSKEFISLIKDFAYQSKEINLDFRVYNYLDESVKNDKELIDVLFVRNSYYQKDKIDYDKIALHKDLANDKEYLKTLTSVVDVINMSSKELNNDKEFVSFMIQESYKKGFILKLNELSKNLKSDKDLLKMAIKLEPSYIKYFEKKDIVPTTKEEVEILAKTIDKKKSIKELLKIYQKMPKELKLNAEAVKEMLACDRNLFPYLEDEMKANKKIMLMSLNNHEGDNVLHWDKDILNDKDFIIDLIKENDWIAKTIVNKVEKYKNKDFVIECLNIVPDLYNFLDKELKKDMDIILTTLVKGGSIYKEMPEGVKDNREFFLNLFNNVYTIKGEKIEYMDMLDIFSCCNKNLKKDEEIIDLITSNINKKSSVEEINSNMIRLYKILYEEQRSLPKYLEQTYSIERVRSNTSIIDLFPAFFWEEDKYFFKYLEDLDKENALIDQAENGFVNQYLLRNLTGKCLQNEKFSQLFRKKYGDVSVEMILDEDPLLFKGMWAEFNKIYLLKEIENNKSDLGIDKPKVKKSLKF